MMKYASNHHWKFKQWWTAYFVGFMQFSILIACEYVNLIILTSNHSMLDILMNFMAIIVITEFDDHFFLIIQSEPLSKIVTDGEYEYEEPKGAPSRTVSSEEIFKIEVTSSKNAHGDLPGNRLRLEPEEAGDKATEKAVALEGEPEFVHIQKRSCMNFLFRMHYIICKILYGSLWFYFVPFYSFFFSF